MKVLGAVLAGGQSRRFGSDKALALLAGRPLIDHAVAALTAQCDAVVVVGRDIAPAPCLPDWPAPGMGPLGGLAAALRRAAAEGFDAVLSCAVDRVGLGAGLLAELSPSAAEACTPAYVADQPVIGLWPVGACVAIEAILAGSGKHSLRALAEAIGARAVQLAVAAGNINEPADLLALEHPDGL